MGGTTLILSRGVVVNLISAIPLVPFPVRVQKGLRNLTSYPGRGAESGPLTAGMLYFESRSV